MIDLYYWPTPNGWKVSILLEELGLPYSVKPIDILAGDQFDPAFLAISPNNKVPAIVDHDGPGGTPFSLFESGAILLYLAEKTDRFFAETTRGKYEVVEWLMFQMGGVGPMFGQANHFNRYAPEPVPYGVTRYNAEMARLMGVMDRRLATREWFAGDYSIADMALFGWTADSAAEEQVRASYPHLDRWFRTMRARPAVRRGLAVMADARKGAEEFDEDARSVMFGAKQFESRA